MADNGNHVDGRPTAKDLKRRRKESRRLEKIARKTARKDRKRTRREEWVTVAYRSKFERERLAALLTDLAAGLRSGRIEVEHDGERVNITPPAEIRGRIRARQTHKTERISIRLRWARPAPVEATPGIKVSVGTSPPDTP